MRRLRRTIAMLERPLIVSQVVLLLLMLWTCVGGVSFLSSSATAQVVNVNDLSCVPILVYHRFGAVVTDSMTVTTLVFASHLQYLKEHGYTVIPLRQLVADHLGQGPPPPPQSVVITADDAHRSVYTEMFPLVQQYHIPVTLFVYPSAIANASYAMTWEQLHELKDSGLFDIQSHTYWHPNFTIEKKRLSPFRYEQLVEEQFIKAKTILERRLGGPVDLLAWPFGIYNEELMAQAKAAGYIAAFTIERRHASLSDPVMALPRYLMTNGDRGPAFARLLLEGESERKLGCAS